MGLGATGDRGEAWSLQGRAAPQQDSGSDWEAEGSADVGMAHQRSKGQPLEAAGWFLEKRNLHFTSFREPKTPRDHIYNIKNGSYYVFIVHCFEMKQIPFYKVEAKCKMLRALNSLRTSLLASVSLVMKISNDVQDRDFNSQLPQVLLGLAGSPTPSSFVCVCSTAL